MIGENGLWKETKKNDEKEDIKSPRIFSKMIFS